MNTVITLKLITKLYDNMTAVDNLSLDVNEGEILGLIGPNGAGKTTTLKMMAGLSKPTSGFINVMGHDITGDSSKIKKHFKTIELVGGVLLILIGGLILTDNFQRIVTYFIK